jgi:predicted ArsR family transcriptional regulator
VLLDAVRRGDLEEEVVNEAAHVSGVEIGKVGLANALTATGYEPVTEGGETRFRNCPFHELRERDQDTTCGMNLALVEGMVEGSGADARAVLAPEDGYCCVRLSPPVTG